MYRIYYEKLIIAIVKNVYFDICNKNKVRKFSKEWKKQIVSFVGMFLCIFYPQLVFVWLSSVRLGF